MKTPFAVAATHSQSSGIDHNEWMRFAEAFHIEKSTWVFILSSIL
ncbi:MAG: hypothetical protein ACJAUP_000390 [Cellvibrionaceae bacterium]|jgi:hypothetical protein